MNHPALPRSPRCGWTIVEVMIGVLVLALFVYSVFTVFVRTAQNTDVGAWKVGAQEKIRASMKILFTDLSAATYPAWIYPHKTDVDTSDRWKLVYKEGGIPLDKGAGEGEILKFYVCKPGRRNFPRNYGRHIVECVLDVQRFADGRPKLVYTRRTIEDSGVKDDTLEKADASMVFFEDLVRVNFEAKKFIDEATADVNNREKIRFKAEFFAAHPKYPATTISVPMECVLQVAANGEKIDVKEKTK